jgi:hypothetical protein
MGHEKLRNEQQKIKGLKQKHLFIFLNLILFTFMNFTTIFHEVFAQDLHYVLRSVTSMS